MQLEILYKCTVPQGVASFIAFTRVPPFNSCAKRSKLLQIDTEFPYFCMFWNIYKCKLVIDFKINSKTNVQKICHDIGIKNKNKKATVLFLTGSRAGWSLFSEVKWTSFNMSRGPCMVSVVAGLGGGSLCT